jgi:hypothetical protein
MEYPQKGKTPRVIKTILEHKFKSFLASIEDEKLQKIVRRDSIITGGAIANLLLGEPVNDYDIYFKTQKTAFKVAEYYLKKYKELNPGKICVSDQVQVDKETGRVRIVIQSRGVVDTPDGYALEDVEEEPVEQCIPDPGTCPRDEEGNAVLDTLPQDNKYLPVFLSSNAITLTDKVQLVIRFYGDVEEIHKNYDFVHCTNAWTSSDKKLHLRTDALLALMSRQLVYVGSRYPVCSLIRTRKFIKRGFSINAGQYVKMCMQVSELDLNDPAVLEDQLVGVDAAYFLTVISMCAAKFDGKPIETEYLIEVLDKVFGTGSYEDQ